MKGLDLLQGITPKDNDDNKKQLIGDAVFEVVEATIITAKSTGVDYIKIEFSATHPVEPKGDKECNIVYGDRITKMYDMEDEKKMQAFANDMFTAGFDIDSSSEEQFIDSLKSLTGKLVYFRCWMSSFKDKDTGDEITYNRQLIKNSKLITEDLKQPKVPF